MNSTAILEMFLVLFFAEIVGLLLLRLSYSLKKKEKSRFLNATKAIVSSVRVEEERTSDDYFKKNTYILGLVYMDQSSYTMEDFYSNYEYDVDTVIDVEVVDGKVKAVLTPPPRDIVDNFDIVTLNGHQIIFWIGIIICFSGALGFTIDVIDVLGEKNIFLKSVISVGILLSIYILLNKRKERYKSKINLIKSGGYTVIVGKIIDIKKKVTLNGRKVNEYYYPIVEYQEGYDVKKKVIYNNIGKENKLNESMLIYKDRSTGEVLSEQDVKFLQFRIKVLNFFAIFVLVIIGVCIISYL